MEVRLRERFSIEANILHRPMKLRFVYPDFPAYGSSLTAFRAWEFPVMLKYTLPALRSAGRVRPFLEVGPAFRTQEDASATEPSQFGISAGVGAAFHLGPFRLAPSLRYTRWARESIYPRYATKPDQIELLTAISWGFDLDYTVDGRIWSSEFTVLTWQFPVLAKLNLRPSTRFQPIFEAGTSFRLYGNAGGYNPSRFGFTVGAEGETKLGRLTIGPVVRYTRWARDTLRYGWQRTAQNQVELLLKFFF